MGYKVTNKEAKNINVEFIFKIDTLDNHLHECISIIPALLDVLPDYKHLYEPKCIEDYYDRLKRMYESRKCEWKNRQPLWQKH